MRIDYVSAGPILGESMLETTSDRASTETPVPSAIVLQRGREILRVEPWGRNSVRVRVSLGLREDDSLGALLATPPASAGPAPFEGRSARLVVNDLSVDVDEDGRLRFSRASDGDEILAEEPIRFLWPGARSFPANGNGYYRIEQQFRAYPGERLFGLGQHQHGRLDQKGIVVDLEQSNAEVTVPFLVSSRGYGLLWNNPAVGRVELGGTGTRWVADSSRQIDYWLTVGSPAEIAAQYAEATGRPPTFPAWAAGFWQSKLRYRTQDELLGVAREHKRRGLPLSVIVCDFFHWPLHGEWRFQPDEWPDPQAMVDELRELGVELMVSVWPTVNPASSNYAEMDRRGLLVRNTAGLPLHMAFFDRDTDGPVFLRYYDATNPEARRYLWDKISDGYRRYGIRAFWLDACEPEILADNAETALYLAGQGSEVQGVYPREHARGFYEGLTADGETGVMLLCRSAWAGSQRYGAAVWSGDVESTFEALAAQVPAGLNMGISGIPWWTTDIGGFRNGDPTTAYFRELVVRWFQFATFCPLFRLHGVRNPETGVGPSQTGADNEVWSFGEEAYGLIREQLVLREGLRPYVMEQMA